MVLIMIQAALVMFQYSVGMSLIGVVLVNLVRKSYGHTVDSRIIEQSGPKKQLSLIEFCFIKFFMVKDNKILLIIFFIFN